MASRPGSAVTNSQHFLNDFLMPSAVCCWLIPGLRVRLNLQICAMPGETRLFASAGAVPLLIGHILSHSDGLRIEPS